MSEAIENKRNVLIVDDEPLIRDLLATILSDEYECVTAESAEAALEKFQKTGFDLVISDVNLGGMTGVEMVPRIHAIAPETVVMMISGAASVDSAIDAMRVGVFDYVRKPFEPDQVVTAVRRALNHHDAQVEKRRREADLATLIEQRTTELRHLSHHDVLTDLPNETKFIDQLGHVVSRADANQKVAVMLIEILNLRTVRDTLGSAIADKILVQSSERLKRLVKENTLARLEGDKFALYLEQADAEDATANAGTILEIFEPPFSIDDKELHAQVSFGISMFPVDGPDAQTLIRNARAALSRAESAGGGSQFYAPEFNEHALRRLALENSLRRALARNEFTVLYQPKIAFDSSRITGMEALLRWNSAEVGSVPPDVFIPIAEATGLIISIGEWVLRTACTQAKVWHDLGFQLNVAVNLSARQFQDRHLSNRIWNILQETGIDPHFLNLEVTESSLIESPGAATDILTRLQQLGVSISIDDFGTGHSSLGYLRSLPIDVLKIDKSFISNFTTEADAATLVKTMISLAHDLRLRVVAEGVETEEQLNALNVLGCDEWQGFLRSRPLRADAFLDELRKEANH